jgi:hypothetical protein
MTVKSFIILAPGSCQWKGLGTPHPTQAPEILIKDVSLETCDTIFWL